MPKYKYQVISEDNKALEGTITSPDIQAARKELNTLGFSVVSIEEIPEGAEAAPAEGAEEIPVFEFGATDKNQKKIIGTIQSEDRYAAYKRLMSEYTFEVQYVIDNSLSEEEKVKARAKGAYDLAKRIEKEESLLHEKETAKEKDLKEFKKQQEILNEQIDFVLSKVKAMLDLYEKDMLPEIKGKIRTFVDKLLRIRTSTNLDYVRKTAEELLQYLQKEELFLHADSKRKERTKMVLEAKSMMMQLRHNKKAATRPSATVQVKAWREEHIINNPNPSGLDRILNIFASLLIGITPDNPDVVTLKKEISLNGDQLKQYLQLYFQTPEPEFKAETKHSLSKLWARRKKLQRQLKELKRNMVKQRKASPEETSLEKFNREVFSFSGWLLAFYLIYYFVSIYAVSKDFGIADTPYISTSITLHS